MVRIWLPLLPLPLPYSRHFSLRCSCTGGWMLDAGCCLQTLPPPQSCCSHHCPQRFHYPCFLASLTLDSKPRLMPLMNGAWVHGLLQLLEWWRTYFLHLHFLSWVVSSVPETHTMRTSLSVVKTFKCWAAKRATNDHLSIYCMNDTARHGGNTKVNQAQNLPSETR